MDNLSKNNLYVLETMAVGYDINKEGYIIRKNKSIIKNFRIDSSGYHVITFRLPSNSKACVKIHKLQAFKKFGERMFDKGVIVRHLDGNSLNNSWNNIAIGTSSDNMMDILPDVRFKKAIIATRKMQDNIRSYEDRCLIYDDLKLGKSYSEIMKKYDISSKGTLSFMKNKSLEYKEYISL